jgi:surface polysaccharide O-acyltransferase-like enzyme
VLIICGRSNQKKKSLYSNHIIRWVLVVLLCLLFVVKLKNVLLARLVVKQGRASIIQGPVPIFSFFFFVKNIRYKLISFINRD